MAMFNILGAEPSANSHKQTSSEKHTEDHQTNRPPSCSATLIYQASIAELDRSVTVTWSKNVMNYSLTVSIENPNDESHPYTCKIDLKTWQFWGRKGLKSVEVDGKRVDIYWDFRQAKFSHHPEPSSDYYVAVVYGEEVVLVIGDMKKDAFKRTRKRPSLIEPILRCKKENVYGKRTFCTKSMLNKGKAEHDIVIEFSTSGLGDPEMWISVDGFEVIHVMNLHWRFRGNENVSVVEDVKVQVFWDVHDWLYSSSGPGHGLFIFKPAPQECVPDTGGEDYKRCSSGGGGRYDSPQEMPSTPEFFHAIYTWKAE